MSNLDIALQYYQRGLLPIPCNLVKKPIIKWKELQDTMPDESTIKSWWATNSIPAMAIITGKISNIVVVDIDDMDIGPSNLAKYIPADIETPTAITPTGGLHYYFKYPGKELRNNTEAIPGCDFRGDGGYIIAPPSHCEYEKKGKFIKGDYKWIKSIFDVPLADLPDAYISFILSFSFALYKGDDEFVKDGFRQGENSIRQFSSNSSIFVEGKRDDALFHAANCLVKGNAEEKFLNEIMQILGRNCNPPFPPDELQIKIKSAIERAKRKERNVLAEVMDEINSSNGIFFSSEIERVRQFSSLAEKKNVSQILRRLAKEGVIEKAGDRNGCWRKIDKDIEYMDFVNVSVEGAIDLTLPLDIHKKTIFFPKNVIVIAGVTGYGKTSFLLNMMRSNMEKFQWKYFMSEMSPLALNYKLTRFNWPIEAWKMDVIPDYVWDFHNIPDKIFPNAMNVIDYLEPEGERTYYIHEVITKIIKKLDKGMAIIATQKKPQADLSAGGVYSSKAASLYLSLDWGTINIFKNRFREEDKQPLRTRRDFEIQPGQHFVAKGNWYDPNERKRKSKLNEVIDDEGGFIEE